MIKRVGAVRFAAYASIVSTVAIMMHFLLSREMPVLTGQSTRVWVLTACMALISTVLPGVDLHHARTGTWPKQNSGCVEDAQGEKWANLENALRIGLRGLSGGSSLASLINEHRVGRR